VRRFWKSVRIFSFLSLSATAMQKLPHIRTTPKEILLAEKGPSHCSNRRYWCRSRLYGEASVPWCSSRTRNSCSNRRNQNNTSRGLRICFECTRESGSSQSERIQRNREQTDFGIQSVMTPILESVAASHRTLP
jgi:hypothetical protein